MRLVEEISGVGQLVLHGHVLGDTPYRISRYQGFLEANGLPVPGLHRIEGVVELQSVTVPPEWIGIPLTLKLQDGRTFGITLLDSDGRILSEGHGPTKCLCC